MAKSFLSPNSKFVISRTVKHTLLGQVQQALLGLGVRHIRACATIL